MYKYKLSICMMVKDEGKNIEQCLESIKTLMSNEFIELIIVDTGSSDNTVEVCKRYTEKLYFHKWNDDFSAMRNKTISYAAGEWIMILDGDEVLENPDELLSVLEQKNLTQYNTITFKEKNLYDYKENKYTLISTYRIFKNDGEFHYKGTVHNQPSYKEPILNTDIMLKHYGYIIDDKDLMEKKFKRTTELLKREIKKDPNNFYYIFQLGVSYSMHNDNNLAWGEFKRALQKFYSIGMKMETEYEYLITSVMNAGLSCEYYEEVVKYIKKYEKTCERLPEFNYVAGCVYHKLNNYDEVNKYLKRYINSVEKITTSKYYNNPSIALYSMDEETQNKVKIILSLNYYNMNNYEESLGFAKLCNKDDFRYKNLMINNLLKINDERLVEFLSELSDLSKEEIYNGIEIEISKYDDDKKLKIRRNLSNLKDFYGEVNRKIISDIDYNEEAPRFILANKDNLNNRGMYELLINTDPTFIFKMVKQSNREVASQILNYIFEKNYKVFEKFIEILETKKPSKRDIGLNFTGAYALELQIINKLKENKIDENIINTYDLYINYGINFVELLYGEKLRIHFDYILDLREKFFAINKFIKETADLNLRGKYIKDLIMMRFEFAKLSKIYLEDLVKE